MSDSGVDGKYMITYNKVCNGGSTKICAIQLDPTIVHSTKSRRKAPDRGKKLSGLFPAHSWYH